MSQRSSRNVTSSSSSEIATSKTFTTSIGSGCSSGRERSSPTKGVRVKRAGDGGEAVELGDDLDQRGVEADLLLRLAERRRREVGVDRLVELAARERDLALVRAASSRGAW